MRKIHKMMFQPRTMVDSHHSIEFQGLRPISVGVQNGCCVVWFEVDTKDPMIHRFTLQCVNTGYGCVPSGSRFLGTIDQNGYAWHIYTPDLGYVSESRMTMTVRIPTDEESFETYTLSDTEINALREERDD